MRIEINKNKQESNFRQHVQTIIYMASDCAKRGIKEFRYNIPTDTGRSYGELLKAVEFETEGTVISYDAVIDYDYSHRDGLPPVGVQSGKIYFEIK
jgi:hypothetical protein